MSKLYEQRRIKKIIEYNQGYIDALSFVINSIEIDERDSVAIEDSIEEIKDKINYYEKRLRSLPKDE